MAKARGKQSGFLDQLVAGLGLGPQPAEQDRLPYCLRRDVLSADELLFFKVLQRAISHLRAYDIGFSSMDDLQHHSNSISVFHPTLKAGAKFNEGINP